MPGHDDYLGHAYSKEWRPTYSPNNDSALEFVGYENDQPVWRKKTERSVAAEGSGCASDLTQPPATGPWR